MFLFRSEIHLEVVSIRITPETMTMAPMICTTQDGVRNVFRDVQVKEAEEKTLHFNSNFKIRHSQMYAL